MPIVDIDRAGPLDKIHAKRMLHAFSQIALRLVALEDPRVDEVLNSYSITILPGPVAAIEYAPFAKQILEKELGEAKKAAAKKPKAKLKQIRVLQKAKKK